MSEEKNFEAMVVRCGMGDLSAMLWMWEHFHSQLADETLSLEEAYLSDPAAGNRLAGYLNERREESICIQSASFWLCRANLYGSAEAAALLERHPARENLSLIPTAYQRPGQNRWPPYPGSIPLLRYSGPEVYARLGLPALVGNHLDPMDQDGFYRAEDYSGYDGRDESGFGMEEEYDFSFYDEFFQFLFILRGWSRIDLRIRSNVDRIHRECEKKRAEKQAERERFWAENAGNAEMQRYRPLYPLSAN